MTPESGLNRQAGQSVEQCGSTRGVVRDHVAAAACVLRDRWRSRGHSARWPRKCICPAPNLCGRSTPRSGSVRWRTCAGCAFGRWLGCLPGPTYRSLRWRARSAGQTRTTPTAASTPATACLLGSSATDKPRHPRGVVSLQVAVPVLGPRPSCEPFRPGFAQTVPSPVKQAGWLPASA